ncbi:hypothetical protein FOZ61_006399 [Perkinsus olseni]|uniref:Endonuclease/exonuclease/phosphatase domain-containing protein n=1 Tax=Perkinsus olseni TaxID=32597 RepID=A0A7J6LDG6_PEROL|nr:hypothetical protein FOZ61_006399 [Perkinsus olseni]
MEIYEWIREQGYRCICSIHDPPTFQGPQGSSWVDITATSREISHFVTRQVLDNSMAGSDHLPIKLWIPPSQCGATGSKRAGKITTRWNYRKADWEKFQTHLDARLQSLDLSASTASLHNSLAQAYKSAAKHGIPRGYIHQYRPFWNSRLNSLRLSKNRLRRAIQKRCAAGKPVDRLEAELRHTTTSYHAALAQAKRQSWDNFTSKLSSKSRKVWKVVKGMVFGPKPSPPTEIEGWFGGEAAAKYATYLSETVYKSRLSPATRREWRGRAYRIKDYKQHLYDGPLADQSVQQAHPFSLDELERAFARLDLSTASGPDEVSAQMLKHSTTRAKQVCLQVINKAFSELDVPHQWRRGRTDLCDKPVSPGR